MTDKQFDAQWQALQDRCETVETRAKAYRDQREAAFLAKSGWTQERIGARIGKSISWVSYRLRFGAFLDYSTTVEKLKTPRNLTEGKFRGYWEQTTGKKDEPRFRKVVAAMEEDFIIAKPGHEVGQEIVDKFADWKWRTIEAMWKATEFDREQMTNALQRMKNQETHRIMCESRKYKATTQWRLKRLPKTSKKISASQLAVRIAPIIREGYEMTRDTNQVEYSRTMAAACFNRIEKLLAEIGIQIPTNV